MSNSRPSSGVEPHVSRAVLGMLRAAGRRGVPYVRIRSYLGGVGPETVLDELRALGHVVQRTPSSDGILAILLEPIDRAT